MSAILYKITTPSDKSYLGVTTKGLNHRVNQHPYFDTAIGRAIRKYGVENIKAEILVIGDEEYIYSLEKQAIEVFNTMPPEGYNLREGGEGGRWTEASKEKLSESLKGRQFSEEHKRNIGKTSKDRKHTVETRKKMSISQSKRHAEGRGFIPSHKGHKHSEETRQKMREAWKLRRLRK